MLKTWKFGAIRIMKNRPDYHFNTLIEIDLAGEWEYWQLLNGEIVAWAIPQE